MSNDPLSSINFRVDNFLFAGVAHYVPPGDGYARFTARLYDDGPFSTVSSKFNDSFYYSHSYPLDRDPGVNTVRLDIKTFDSDSGRTFNHQWTFFDGAKERGDLVIEGKSSADVALGGSGDDRIETLRGNDWILAGNGDDVLNGGSGRDHVKGGSGRDTLIGAIGGDDLFGGGSADTFVFQRSSDSLTALARRDVVHDFSRAQGDHLDFHSIDADRGSAGNQSFDFIGRRDFSGDGGELRVYVKPNRDTVVMGDNDGDGRADFAVELEGRITLRDGDFLL